MCACVCVSIACVRISVSIACARVCVCACACVRASPPSQSPPAKEVTVKRYKIPSGAAWSSSYSALAHPPGAQTRWIGGEEGGMGVGTSRDPISFLASKMTHRIGSIPEKTFWFGKPPSSFIVRRDQFLRPAMPLRGGGMARRWSRRPKLQGGSYPAYSPARERSSVSFG